MNFQASDYNGYATGLKICVADGGHEKPVPVEIKYLGNGRREMNDLPAMLSRPQCGQKTFQTVEPAL